MIIQKVFNLVEEITAKEEALLRELDVEGYLSKAIETSEGLRRFAEAFYFVRYDFCRLNFIVGERCSCNEFLWAGLVKNLMEELGGKHGSSHNQLYRDFLFCVGAKPEDSLQEPSFAHQFNTEWQNFSRNAPLLESLSAIAIYEIFDNPDYKLLLRLMQKSGVEKRGLIFFQIHAQAKHFQMFEDIIAWLMNQKEGEEAFINAMTFVFKTQNSMWLGLIKTLIQYPTDKLILVNNK